MRSDRRDTPEGTGRAGPAFPSESARSGKHKSVDEVWTEGRLKQAEKLLRRFENEFDERDSRDATLLRDYYRWTGEPHYRTEYGWSPGRPEDNDEDPADVIERVNC